MISLQTLFTEPRSIGDFFRLAIKSPRDFAKNLKLDEHLKYSVLVGFLLFAITSFAEIVGLDLFQLILRCAFVIAVVFIGGGFTFLIAYLSKAKLNYKECVTLTAYLSILTIPFAILNNLLTIFSLFSSAIYFFFTYLVLVESRDANKNTVTWICGIFMLLIFTSFLI